MIPSKFRLEILCFFHTLAKSYLMKITTLKQATAAAFMVGTTEFSVPLGDMIDKDEEIKKLRADLEYLEGFRNSILKKLSNENFVNRAPAAVIEGERKKLADSESKIAAIQESLAALA